MMGWIGAVGGGLFFAVLLSRGKKGKASGNKSTADFWTSPIWVPDSPESVAIVSEALCRLGATLSGVDLEQAVWREVWPGVPWPGQPVRAGDHPTVATSANLLHELALAYAADPDVFCAVVPTPKPDDGPDDGGDGSDQPIEALEDPGGYPTPGRFYQVVYGDYFGGTNSQHSIVYRALLSAGYIAAKQAGYTDAAASDFARNIAKSDRNRGRYRNLIQDSPWNLRLYGTRGYDPKLAIPGPSGLAIRLLPVHAPVRQMLKQRALVPRMIALGSVADGSASGSGNRLEYLWLPSLDLKALLTGISTDTRIVPVAMDPPEPWESLIDPNTLPSMTWGTPPFSVTTP